MPGNTVRRQLDRQVDALFGRLQVAILQVQGCQAEQGRGVIGGEFQGSFVGLAGLGEAAQALLGLRPDEPGLEIIGVDGDGLFGQFQRRVQVFSGQLEARQTGDCRGCPGVQCARLAEHCLGLVCLAAHDQCLRAHGQDTGRKGLRCTVGDLDFLDDRIQVTLFQQGLREQHQGVRVFGTELDGDLEFFGRTAVVFLGIVDGAEQGAGGGIGWGLFQQIAQVYLGRAWVFLGQGLFGLLQYLRAVFGQGDSRGCED